jgi:hypothetical protein
VVGFPIVIGMSEGEERAGMSLPAVGRFPPSSIFTHYVRENAFGYVLCSFLFLPKKNVYLHERSE